MGEHIAAALGKFDKKQGYFVLENGDILTWCFGHMLEPLMPEDLDEKYKYWTLNTLPILPEALKNKVSKSKAQQFAVIQELLAKHKDAVVVHACYAGREGQLIGDEILIFCNWKGKTDRLWLNELTPGEITRAFAAIKPNDTYKGMLNAALSRQYADWVTGINLTRLFTLKARSVDPNTGVLSYGRVQTPTLKLVVDRDIERANFRPKDYYLLYADFDAEGTRIRAKWQIPDGCLYADDSGRITDKAFLQGLADGVKGTSGRVAKLKKTLEKKSADLPYDLAVLQRDANKKLDMSAARTLEIAQSLYEKKLTTYPRTECRYLPDDVHAAAPTVFATLQAYFGDQIICGADPKIRNGAWDSRKVIEHSGIIPTGSMPEGALGDEEKAVFRLIAERYLLQFYGMYTYEATAVVVETHDGAEKWSANGRRIVDLGWRARSSEEGDGQGDDNDDGKDVLLPSLREGQEVVCSATSISAKQTTKPAQFRDGTLIEAMTQVYKYVLDPAIKAKLKETSGIGTPAGRANFIEILLKRTYIQRSGKYLESTALGRSMIKVVPPELSDPGYTALLGACRTLNFTKFTIMLSNTCTKGIVFSIIF
jgi:DNA topoisomerase-3